MALVPRGRVPALRDNPGKCEQIPEGVLGQGLRSSGKLKELVSPQSWPCLPAMGQRCYLLAIREPEWALVHLECERLDLPNTGMALFFLGTILPLVLGSRHRA